MPYPIGPQHLSPLTTATAILGRRHYVSGCLTGMPLDSYHATAARAWRFQDGYDYEQAGPICPVLQPPAERWTTDVELPVSTIDSLGG